MTRNPEKDLYAILGVARDAAPEAIKAAYRKLARKWHPDHNPGSADAERKFKDISTAYSVLGSDEKRKLYDEFGSESLQSGFDPETARARRDWGNFHRTSGGEEFGRYHSFDDVFGDFASFGGEGFRSSPRPMAGRDVSHDLTLDLLSALRGMETEFSLSPGGPCPACDGTGEDRSQHPGVCHVCGGAGQVEVARSTIRLVQTCPACRGRGRVGRPCGPCQGSGRSTRTETIRVTIPAGVHEGSRVRVAGKGEAGRNGGPAGDLYLVIHITPHPFLTRDGDNLTMDVPLTVREAVAGAAITIPTIYGPVSVKIPPRSQSGQILKLKGKGAVNSRTGKKGDLLIRLVVKVPQTDDPDVLAAADSLEAFYSRSPREALHLE